MGRNKFSWGQNSEKRIKKLIKNYNARITYQRKKNPNAVLPEKVYWSKVQKDVTSQNAYKNLVTKLKNWRYIPYTDVKVQYGDIKVSKAEYDAYMKTIEQINKNRKKFVDKYSKYGKEDGKDVYGNVQYKYNSVLSNALKANNRLYTPTEPKSEKDWQHIQDIAKSWLAETTFNTAAKKYYENLLEIVEIVFSQEQINVLKPMIEQIGAEKLLHYYYISGVDLDLDFYYEDVADVDDKYNTLHNILKMITNSKLNP